MPEFLQNNRFGLGAGLMVTLLAAAFTDGLGLLPMLLGGLAFALVGGVLGKDDKGIMSGLFKKSPDAPAPAPSTEPAKGKPAGKDAPPPSPTAAEAAAKATITLTQDKTSNFANIKIGEADFDGKAHDVIMQGIVDKDKVTIQHVIMQDKNGTPITDAKNDIIGVKLREPLVATIGADNKITLPNDLLNKYAKEVPAAIEKMALQNRLVDTKNKPVNATRDGSQVLVIDVDGKNTPQMRDYIKDMLASNGAQNSDFITSLAGAGEDTQIRMQIAVTGKLSGDKKQFTANERNLTISTSNNLAVSLKTETNDTSDARTVEYDLYRAEQSAAARSGASVKAYVDNALPREMIMLRAQMESAPVSTATPPREIDAALEQFRTNQTLANADVNKRLPKNTPVETGKTPAA